MSLVANGQATVTQLGFDIPDGYSVKAAWKLLKEEEASPLPKKEVSFKASRGLLDVAAPAASALSPHGRVQLPVLPFTGRVEVEGTAPSSPRARRLVRSVVRGLRAAQEPCVAEGGLGGTYFFCNEAGRKVAIMKPCDEEPLAPANPKGFVGRALGDPGLKATVRVGEAAMREVAAYLLDHDHFANVPATVLVKITHPVFHVPAAAAAAEPDTPAGAAPHAACECGCVPQSPSPATVLVPAAVAASPCTSCSVCSTPPIRAGCVEAAAPPGVPCKLGSLQEFAAHECDTSEMGASRFSTRDVHRIGILDLRLFNTDRHAGNILVRRPRGSSAALGLARLAEAQLELVPIDHGFCLPEALEPPYFEWLHWPQAMIPFDEEELAYIGALDAEADCELLRRELPGLRPECLRTLVVATTLLQAGAAAGLSLAEIGTMASRPLVGLEEELSDLERLCLAARQDVFRCQREDGSEAGSEVGSEAGSDSGSEGDSELGDLADLEQFASRTLSHRLNSIDLASDMQINSSPESHGSLLAGSVTRYAGAGGVHYGDQMLSRSSDDLQFHLDEDAAAGLRGSHLASPAMVALAGMPPSARGAGQAGLHHAHTASPAGPSSPELLLHRPGGGAGLAAAGGLRRGAGGSGSWSSLESPLAEWQDSGLALDGQRGSPRASEASTGFGAPPGPQDMAMSLYPGLGVPAWHAATQRARTARRRRRGAHKPPRAAMYPPPVEGAPAAAVNAVFSGLEGESWAAFMVCVRTRLAEGLCEGRWRCAAREGPRGAPPLGMSCPRF